MVHKNGGRNKVKVTEDQAETLFYRVGVATDALFPKGVPGDRVLEVAEWQRATIELLTRK